MYLPQGQSLLFLCGINLIPKVKKEEATVFSCASTGLCAALSIFKYKMIYLMRPQNNGLDNPCKQLEPR